MRDPSRIEELIQDLKDLNGVERIHTIAAENESEV
jgi:hypothetical protein